MRHAYRRIWQGRSKVGWALVTRLPPRAFKLINHKWDDGDNNVALLLACLPFISKDYRIIPHSHFRVTTATRVGKSQASSSEYSVQVCFNSTGPRGAFFQRGIYQFLIKSFITNCIEDFSFRALVGCCAILSKSLKEPLLLILEFSRWRNVCKRGRLF